MKLLYPLGVCVIAGALALVLPLCYQADLVNQALVTLLIAGAAVFISTRLFGENVPSLCRQFSTHFLQNEN